MLATTKRNNSVIYERSEIIPIPASSQAGPPSPVGEYSLKQHFFDPSKSSPPNEFMLKLRQRVSKFHFDKKEDNWLME
jgi:hypothetical protein